MGKAFLIDSGKLRHRLDVQNVVETEDELGTEVISFTSAFKAWGSIDTLKGAELVQAREVVTRATHKIRMRFLEGLTERNRIVHNGNVYNIEALNDIEQRHKTLELICIQDKGTFGDGSAD